MIAATRAISATAGSLALAGCAQVTALSDDSVLRQQDGATHTVALFSTEQTETLRLRERALNVARRECGLPGTATEEDVALRAGIFISVHREYAFTCPVEGEVSQ